MRHRTTILYTIAWIAYIVFTFGLFPYLNTNVLIPSVILLGLGGWLFGRTVGFCIGFVALAHQFLLYQTFAADYAHFEERAVGPFLYITLVGLSGTLRNNLDGIKEANERLDKAVLVRTEELGRLTQRIIEHLETARISRGQELHDGIGQQLTGIQLYATSLADQLAAEQNGGASLAYSLTTRSRIIHNKIRHASRTVYPMQIRKVGLRPALDELASCLRLNQNVEASAETVGDVDSVPASTALQLYRICQETALLVISRSRAKRISIKVASFPSSFELAVVHDGIPTADTLANSTEARLIDYRVAQIHGSMESRREGERLESLKVSIPKTLEETAG
ncbi:sensor histidine kinase [Pontiella desulfatans]|nr:histidine kinase [Pontiella desulfatans]